MSPDFCYAPEDVGCVECPVPRYTIAPPLLLTEGGTKKRKNCILFKKLNSNNSAVVPKYIIGRLLSIQPTILSNHAEVMSKN